MNGEKRTSRTSATFVALPLLSSLDTLVMICASTPLADRLFFQGYGTFSSQLTFELSSICQRTRTGVPRSQSVVQSAPVGFPTFDPLGVVASRVDAAGRPGVANPPLRRVPPPLQAIFRFAFLLINGRPVLLTPFDGFQIFNFQRTLSFYYTY